MIAGFTKCGTTDLWKFMISQQPYVMKRNKENHWWDKHHRNVNQYTRKISSSTHDLIQWHEENKENQHIIIDGTPRTIWHGDHWQYDIVNKNLDIPQVLMPHKIHHLNPLSKIIVIMRDPTYRLISDYKFYVRAGRNISAEDFHDKVSIDRFLLIAYIR